MEQNVVEINQKMFEGEFSSEVIPFSKNKYIFEENKQFEGVFFITKGKVKIIKENEEQTTILWLASNNELIGINSQIDTSDYTYSAVAITKTEGFFVPIDRFEYLVREIPAIQNSVVNFLNKRVEFLEQRSVLKQFNSTKQRFEGLLKYLVKIFKSKKIDLTIEDLANLVDTTEFYLIKIINKLKKENIVFLNKNNLLVVDVNLL